MSWKVADDNDDLGGVARTPPLSHHRLHCSRYSVACDRSSDRVCLWSGHMTGDVLKELGELQKLYPGAFYNGGANNHFMEYLEDLATLSSGRTTSISRWPLASGGRSCSRLGS